MKRALLIGIEYTSTPYYTPGCFQDVHTIKSMLMKQEYTENNITVLTDDSLYTPCKLNILHELDRFTTLPSSEIFIYYAGQRPLTREHAIVPCDFHEAGYIDPETVSTYLHRMKSKTIFLTDSNNVEPLCILPYTFMYTGYELIASVVEFKLTNSALYTIHGTRSQGTTRIFLDSMSSTILSTYISMCKKMTVPPILCTSSPIVRNMYNKSIIPV